MAAQSTLFKGFQADLGNSIPNRRRSGIDAGGRYSVRVEQSSLPVTCGEIKVVRNPEGDHVTPQIDDRTTVIHRAGREIAEDHLPVVDRFLSRKNVSPHFPRTPCPSSLALLR